LLDRAPDGVSPDPAVTRRTMDRLLDYAKTHPTVYLPSHDPQSVERLRKKQLLQ
jgi:glyoxylase-like metal-dependent hydrolase (beta-lactamase superfamily II)